MVIQRSRSACVQVPRPSAQRQPDRSAAAQDRHPAPAGLDRPTGHHRQRETLGRATRRGKAKIGTPDDAPWLFPGGHLGVHIQVAVQWQKASGGDWAAYADEISRRKKD